VPHESSFPALARLAGRVTVGAQELVELVQIGNLLADEGYSGESADEWFRANAALARTAELEE
jgi:hypothetical protein